MSEESEDDFTGRDDGMGAVPVANKSDKEEDTAPLPTEDGCPFAVAIRGNEPKKRPDSDELSESLRLKIRNIIKL